MVFNTTFNNISVVSWWSVLLLEETGVPRENHRHDSSHWPYSECLLFNTSSTISYIIARTS